MISHSVRGNFAAGDRESEVQILQTPAFADLVAFIFKSPFHTNEYLWAELLSLLKEGINAEPSYLGTFCRLLICRTHCTGIFVQHPPG